MMRHRRLKPERLRCVIAGVVALRHIGLVERGFTAMLKVGLIPGLRYVSFSCRKTAVWLARRLMNFRVGIRLSGCSFGPAGMC